MTARTVSMGAPFGWLMKALDVGRKQPKALFGGFGLLLLVAAVPSVLQLGTQTLFPTATTALMVVYGLSLLLSLLLMPPLSGSAFRLLHACESGQPAAASDIFAGIRTPGFALRMILTMLLVVAGYLLVFGLLFALLPGKDFFIELFTRAIATPPGGQPDMTGMPDFPPSFLLWFLGAMAAVLVLSNAYMLAFARAALNERGPVPACVDGVLGTLKNLLPFTLIALAAVVVGFVAVLIVSVLLVLVVGLLAAMSPALAIAVAVPIYFGLMLVMYVIAFGYYYHAWRDIYGEPVVAPEDALVA